MRASALIVAQICSEALDIEKERVRLDQSDPPDLSDRILAEGSDLQTVERRRIEQAMRDSDGNKSRAATRLGLTRTQLYVRLRRYDRERAAVS
jgi:transcriptional regulator with GAF, ATPase, and Fis domain